MIRMTVVLALWGTVGGAQVPEWCQQLPRPQYSHLVRVPLADPWFEVYNVGHDVFAIYEPQQSEEAISFLIIGQERDALFDTGLGIGDIKHLVETITDHEILVINSHTHDDHVGGNWAFGNVLGMDTPFARQNAKGSRVDAQAELDSGSVCGSLPPGFDAKAHRTRPWHITRWIHDRDTVNLGGRTLQVIATPGHTPDAIALFDAQNGLLFTGDSYYPGPIWLYRPETDLDAYERSVATMATLAPRVRELLTSHNVPVADPSILPQLLTAIREVRARRITPVPAGAGKVEYHIGDITFLMRQ